MNFGEELEIICIKRKSLHNASSITLFLAFIVCFTINVSAKEKVDTRPNIILITPNRLGADQLKQYGGMNHKTPNLDYLADNGMTFYYFLARTNMSSSHRALVTGASDSEKGGTPRVFTLNKVEYRLPLELTKVGYETCFAGKWRWGGWSNTDLAKFLKTNGIAKPHNLGFNNFRGIHSAIGHKDNQAWSYAEVPNDPYYDNSGVFHSNTLTEDTNDKYQPHNTIKYIENFIDYVQEKKEKPPFYLWWSMIFNYTHPSMWYPKTPDENKTRNDDEAYYANIRYMDKMLGRLLTHLKKHKIFENTVILFASISGTPIKLNKAKGVEGIYKGKISYGKNFPNTRRGDGEWNVVYPDQVKEQNYRLPLIVHWPRYIKEKKINSQLYSIEDLLITTAKLGHAKGINAYVSSKKTFKSYNMVPAIKGHANKGEKRVATFMFVQPRLMGSTYFIANYRFAQNREYKLYSDKRFYNIKNDPEETRQLTRLSPLERAIQAQLKQIINDHPTQRQN